MEIPKFLKLEGESLLYNGPEGSMFVFYVPENFFDNTSKNAIAQINGQYVYMLGICNWAIIDKNGKRSELKPFRFPTQIACKPSYIEKAKGLVLDDFYEDTDNDEEEDSDSYEDKITKDYRILKFEVGDQVISQVRVPQLMDNVELFYKLAVITAKIPNTIPYNEGWKLFQENMNLNGSPYGLNSQLFGILWAGLCRDPKDISKPFRYTNMNNMNEYKPISIKLLPKYTGIFQSLVSENFDEGLTSAILMKDIEEKNLPMSPLEKVVTQ